MTRITVINPNTSAELTAAIAAGAAAVAPVGVEVVGVQPSVGVASVESHAEEAIAAVGVLQQVRLHDADTDAFVVACFGDTGASAARELATGPVVGMTEAALTTAGLVAHRFVVITLPERTVAHSDRVIRALGLEHRCLVRAVDVPVADLVTGSTHLVDLFASIARTAIVDDGAEAVVLGCAGLADLVAPLRQQLGVPVIDGVAAAVGIAAGLIAMGVRTSRAQSFASVPGLPVFELREAAAAVPVPVGEEPSTVTRGGPSPLGIAGTGGGAGRSIGDAGDDVDGTAP